MSLPSKPFPELALKHQPLEFRRQYNAEVKRQSRARAKLKSSKVRLNQLPREEYLAHKRRQRQQQRARKKAQASQSITLERSNKADQLKPLELGHGVVLQDSATGNPILQLFAAQKRSKRLAVSETEGKAIFDQVANTGQAKRSLIPAFGLWHSIGSSYGFTDLSRRYRNLAMKLLLWTKSHTNAALHKQEIHPFFKEKLSKRRYIRQHLRKHFGKDIDLLHSFWSTVFLFKNTTSNPHKDTADENPSLLFNFGGGAWLALPEFGVKVKLQRLDTLIFASREYKHYTLVDGDGDQRWGIGCFMRSSILQKEPIHTFAASRKAVVQTAKNAGKR
ncbi:uncharacterized protein UTRI_06447 [Ustilago trichophora]|uniref:Uncharacterized protein n=1 Tax=Ustilago trichophora TaxID=86804 RepID=A0A5C3EL99_9BASI|nr:uncharacterized protein UTRI_06447 [Ustilago trichophora]